MGQVLVKKVQMFKLLKDEEKAVVKNSDGDIIR